MTEHEIIKKLQDKTFVGPYGLMEQRLPGSHAAYRKANEDRAVELYNHPGKWESGYCWNFDSPRSTYAIKPDYQPEPEYEDCEITEFSNNRLGICYRQKCFTNPNSIMIPIHELPSLPNFEGFYINKYPDWTPAEYQRISHRIEVEKKTVYARMRK